MPRKDFKSKGARSLSKSKSPRNDGFEQFCPNLNQNQKRTIDSVYNRFAKDFPAFQKQINWTATEKVHFASTPIKPEPEPIMTPQPFAQTPTFQEGTGRVDDMSFSGARLKNSTLLHTPSLHFYKQNLPDDFPKVPETDRTPGQTCERRRNRPLRPEIPSEPHPYGLENTNCKLNRSRESIQMLKAPQQEQNANQTIYLKLASSSARQNFLWKIKLDLCSKVKTYYSYLVLLTLILVLWKAGIGGYIWTGARHLSVGDILSVESNIKQGVLQPDISTGTEKIEDIITRTKSAKEAVSSIAGDLVALENQINVIELAYRELLSRLNKLQTFGKELESKVSKVKGKMDEQFEKYRVNMDQKDKRVRDDEGNPSYKKEASVAVSEDDNGILDRCPKRQ